MIICPKINLNKYKKNNNSKDRGVSTTESKSWVCRDARLNSNIREVEIRSRLVVLHKLLSQKH